MKNLEYLLPNFFFENAILHYLPKCHSTNDYALELIKAGKAHAGDVVVTDCQSAGRGQRGNTWEAAPGDNLTFSLILEPHFVPVSRQFDLNLTIAPAVAECVETLCPDAVTEVKWPNDIMLNSAKTAGILIENHVKNNLLAYSVVGIGLNINQSQFANARATSPFLITGHYTPPANVLTLLLEKIHSRVLLLAEYGPGRVKKDFMEKLYLKGVPALYKDVATGRQFSAVISDVTYAGTLVLTGHDGQRLEYSFKEIQYCGVAG